MIMLEALMIGIIGTIVGLGLGLLIHIPLAYTGIDLSVFAESLTSFGVGAVIYPILDFSSIINVLIFIPVVSVLGAIYPAVRAIKLDPIYAIRYV
jgi:ABC-type lipoprotein release transport system permease subunit